MTNHQALLKKADRFIRSARLLADDGDFDSAASRLYYAMYYIAQSLLEGRGLTATGHPVLSAYGQSFAKTGDLDPRFHQALMAAYSQRQLGDYSVDSRIKREDVDMLLSDASDFIAAARAWFAR